MQIHSTPRILLLPILIAISCSPGPSFGADQTNARSEAAPGVALGHLEDLLKADDFWVIKFLPKRWEKMKESDRKELLMMFLRKFDSTKPAPLREPRILAVVGRKDFQDRTKMFPHGAWVESQDIYFENGRCAWGVERMLRTDTRFRYQLMAHSCEQHITKEKPFENEWQWGPNRSAFFNEEVNKEQRKLDEKIMIAYKAVIQKMVLPRGRGVERPTDEHLEEEVAFRLKFLLDTSDYPKLRAMPKQWSGLMTDEAQKCLILTLLDHLTDPKELEPLENADDICVFSRLINDIGNPEGEMIEQDIYVVNGRCAWALEKLLKTTLPTFDAKLVKDKKKLKESIREAHLRVIEAMKMPEQPWVKAYKDED